MRWSKVWARACLFKAPGCILNSFTHSEGTSLVETSKKGKEGKSWRGKKCRHNWVCVRSDVVVAGKLATLIGGWSHLSTGVSPPEVPCYFSPPVSPWRYLATFRVLPWGILLLLHLQFHLPTFTTFWIYVPTFTALKRYFATFTTFFSTSTAYFTTMPFH